MEEAGIPLVSIKNANKETRCDSFLEPKTSDLALHVVFLHLKKSRGKY